MISMVRDSQPAAAQAGARYTRRSLFATLMAVPLLGAGSAELGQIRTVYILSMGNGLDQYLANQLTAQGVFQVVTDPHKADAIFTDQIGTKFEYQMEELYPPPPPPEEEKDPEAEGKEEDEPSTEELVKQEVPRFSTFGRGKGNLFLVGRQSRNVVWSIYKVPKNSSSKELNKIALQIVEQLKAHRGGI